MIYHFIKTGFILILLFCWNIQLSAQDNLVGEWVSDSMTFRDKVISIKDKYDRIVIVFNQDQSYVKYFYTVSGIATPENVKLSYHLIDGKLEVADVNGRILKRKKAKERGIYRITYDGIHFATDGNEYTVKYRLQEETLILKYLVENFVEEDYTINFNRK
jgi:hypothetical protein